MARILIGGAGGAPSNNVIMSLRDSGDGDHLIGMCPSLTDLMLSDVDERHQVPTAADAAYLDRLKEIIRLSRPDLLHVQPDPEVKRVSRDRAEIERMGVKLFLPDPRTVEICQDKARSYERWKEAGLPVPGTILIKDEATLRAAFKTLGGRLWLRAIEGAAGKGALPATDYDFAKLWIDRFGGWGKFTAAECLTAESITWLSIWFEGELVVAQTRRRMGWQFSDRTLSGVTGITAVGETCSDPIVNETALAAIKAIDPEPHGIFGVDMTYDAHKRPNPTEINIGRFFTTVYFFTKAGVNFPKIYRDLALHGRFPDLNRKINPLPDGLLWIRGMDVPPLLIPRRKLEALRAV